MAMNKDNLIALLKIIEKDYKFRIESNSDEREADKWSQFHEEIRQQRLTIVRGGIK
tara:strand:- start:648 stop:815 length:168 start_codon:yes stop_codon:yes gene_type:complete